MSIRTRITLQFSLIVVSILMLFSLSIYFFYADFRQDEFYSRLSKKALTTTHLLVNVQEIDHDLLKIIDRNTLSPLYNEKIYVFDKANKLVYSSTDDEPEVSSELLDEIREEKRLEYVEKLSETLGLSYTEGGKHFVVIASAYDVYGRRKLVNLRYILIIGSFISLIISLITGWFFAGGALRPIANINYQVSKIDAKSLNSKIEEGNGHDEIAQLAINFNKMLRRIASSFEVQKNFVNNASHELRTPLAAIISQIQVTMAKERTELEYKNLLQSVLEDAQGLKDLSNGLLELAQSESDEMGINVAPVRVDEVLFMAQNDILKANPDRNVEIDFSEIPESDDSLTVNGHEGMLRTVFLNLMDNACKFSPDHKVNVRITFDEKDVKVAFADEGIGIPEDDCKKIFQPFYRAENAWKLKGHGLGLSICSKVIMLHQGEIMVTSAVGKGSKFEVVLPHV